MSWFSPPNLQVTAGGTIAPARVVALSTTADNQVLQSASNTSPNIGIAQKGTRRAPGTGDDDGNAALINEQLQVWGPSCVGEGELGGTVTRGDRVTSDANGRLITTTTTGDQVVGFAMQSGVLSDLVAILVQPFTL